MSLQEFIMNDNNYAVAYYRYSSHSQNEASIDQQREAAHKYAESRGLKIVQEYEDAGISGTTENRPGYQQMLSDIKRIKPSALILWKTDRLGRDAYLLAVAKHEIRGAGCSICCIAEAISDDSTPEMVLLEKVLDGLAEFYSRQLQQNVKRGIKYNAERGLSIGKRMLGYTTNEDKHYIIDEDKAPIVQKIFRDYVDGKGMQQIVKELNSQGNLTINNKPFTINSIRAILHNRAYIGEYRASGIVIPDAIPRLISDEVFEKAQKQMTMNKHTGVRKESLFDEYGYPRFWLTGKLFCGECGNPMCGVSGTSRTKKTHYYYACAEQKKRHKCSKKPIRKSVIEDKVIALLSELMCDTENLASITVDIANYYKGQHEDNGYLDSLKNEKKTVEKALSNLVKALEQGIFSETTQQRLMELENRKTLISEAIDAEETRRKVVHDSSLIEQYFERFRGSNFEDAEVRNAALEYFIDKIYLYDDRILITFCTTDKTCEMDLKQSRGNPQVGFERFALGSARHILARFSPRRMRYGQKGRDFLCQFLLCFYCSFLRRMRLRKSARKDVSGNMGCGCEVRTHDS